MVTAPQLYFHIKNIFENNRIENPQFEAMCVVEHIFRKNLGTLLLEKPLPPKSKLNLRIISLTEGSVASRYSIFWGNGSFSVCLFMSAAEFLFQDRIPKRWLRQS